MANTMADRRILTQSEGALVITFNRSQAIHTSAKRAKLEGNPNNQAEQQKQNAKREKNKQTNKKTTKKKTQNKTKNNNKNRKQQNKSKQNKTKKKKNPIHEGIYNPLFHLGHSGCNDAA